MIKFKNVNRITCERCTLCSLCNNVSIQASRCVFFVHSNFFLSIFNEWRIHSTHLRNPSFLPSCRASFMMDAPPGGSRLQGDLKKGWTCRQASSPGLTPSHIPLKSRTFSSSRDMISVSFCLNSSDQQRQTDRKTQRQTVRNLRQMCVRVLAIT